ncbi:MAG: 50S ribosomal protein L11 methyltransferase [Candidatus Peribacteraceae bacterium]|nr:50S ribosomal protein L11 methyltransferase [Candidatus Peribacteraceae bacterium]
MIELQRKLMGDRLRNEAFAHALDAAIVPTESTVTDLGAGTGFLSALALQLGAKRAILYEAGEIAALCADFMKKNGLKDWMLIRRHSEEVKDPVRTDILVSETLGNYAYEEHIVEIFRDAKRFVKPGGVIIPSRVEQFVSPVVTSRLWEEINVWDRIGYDLDFSAAKKLTLSNMYVKSVLPGELLGAGHDARVWDTLTAEDPGSSRRSGRAAWTVPETQTVYGFCLHWDALLMPEIVLSTDPRGEATHWEQIFLPLSEPLEVHAGESLHVEIKSDTRYEIGVRVQWTAERCDAAGQVLASCAMDMKDGWIG